MEFEQEEIKEDHKQDYDVEIYSRSAIWGFSIFFSTIFGGILMMINLRVAGYKKAANQVLLFSIGYLILTSILLAMTGTSAYVALGFNMIGAAILTNFFFNKYFPEDDYYPKSIVKPLLVSLFLCICLFLFIRYFGPAAAAK